MEITHKNMIAGVCDKGVEFYAVGEKKVHAFHNGKLWKNFKRMPAAVHGLVRKALGLSDVPLSELEALAFQRWGGLDANPDFDENGNPSDAEYFENHNACFDNGSCISPAQLRVLQLIELSVDEIGTKLFISPYTVTRHIQDMLSNSGLPTTKTLAVWATKKGII